MSVADHLTSDDPQVAALQAIDVQRDQASDEFFDAAAHGRLAIRRCERCSTMGDPTAGRCPTCGSDHMAWVTASGAGVLVTWTIPHGRPGADGVARPAHVLGLVETAEGPWLLAPLIGVPIDRLRAGLPVQVAFIDHVSGERSPVFTVRASS